MIEMTVVNQKIIIIEIIQIAENIVLNRDSKKQHYLRIIAKIMLLST